MAGNDLLITGIFNIVFCAPGLFAGGALLAPVLRPGGAFHPREGWKGANTATTRYSPASRTYLIVSADNKKNDAT